MGSKILTRTFESQKQVIKCIGQRLVDKQHVHRAQTIPVGMQNGIELVKQEPFILTELSIRIL
jgi:hypothetical protein